MPCLPPPADDCPNDPGDSGLNDEQSALLAHAALFDHIAPICGARVLVHDTAGPTGFHAVQLAKAAGAWTVAAAVRGSAEAAAARRAGADLVVDTLTEDLVWALRRHTGHERPVQRVVHGRFGHEPGVDLALLATAGVIAVHGLACARTGDSWWQQFLCNGITLKMIAFDAVPAAALERARADVHRLRAAGRWRDAAPGR